MIRSKGEAGTGDIVEAVRHMRAIGSQIKRLTTLADAELASAAKELAAPLELVRGVAADGRLPVVLFCAGGIATPADASLMMQLGAEGVFVGSGIFKPEDPQMRARAIVEATTHFADPARVASASEGLGGAMTRCSRARWPASSCLHSAAGRKPVRDRAAAATRPPSPRARRHPGPRHVRGHDHARPQPSRLDGHRLPAQRLRAPGALLRDLEFAGLDGPPLRAVFIRAPWIESHATTYRSSPSFRAARSRRARARCWP